MPLTYDLTEVKDRDKSDAGFLITKAMVFHSMAVRMWKVTDENASEWYARIHFVEKNLGETLVIRGEDDPVHEENPRGYYLTPEDVRRHIGLATNQGEETTRRDWIRHVVSRANIEAKRWGGKQYTYSEVRDLLATYADEYLAHVEAA